MSNWSASRFDRVTERSSLVDGASLSENNGQARRVCLLESHPNWLFKEYLTDLSAAEVPRLDRLVALPAGMRPEDRAIVDAHTSWPVARVVDDHRTVGVILPRAPDAFFAAMRSVNGKTPTRIVPIDLLALPDDRIHRRGLSVPTPADRLTVCASLAAVGALFERHGLAYLDWSYANAFWGCTNRVAYVIDVDSCSFGPRMQTETTGWTDPLVPMNVLADNRVDRYRVALLIARCLTGERDVPAVRQAVMRLAVAAPATAEICRQLDRALGAATMADRPPLRELDDLLDRATNVVPRQRSTSPSPELRAAGVVEWRPVRRRTRPAPSAAPVPHRPPAPAASAPAGPRTTPLNTVPIADPPARPAAGRPRSVPQQRPAPAPAQSGRRRSGAGVAVGVAALVIVLLTLAVLLGQYPS